MHRARGVGLDGVLQHGRRRLTLVHADQIGGGHPLVAPLTKLLNLRFLPLLRSNPLGVLVACKWTSSVVDYQGQFEATGEGEEH